MERQPSLVRDPVCGMKFNPQHAVATTALLPGPAFLPGVAAERR